MRLFLCFRQYRPCVAGWPHMMHIARCFPFPPLFRCPAGVFFISFRMPPPLRVILFPALLLAFRAVSMPPDGPLLAAACAQSQRDPPFPICHFVTPSQLCVALKFSIAHLFPVAATAILVRSCGVNAPLGTLSNASIVPHSSQSIVLSSLRETASSLSNRLPHLGHILILSFSLSEPPLPCTSRHKDNPFQGSGQA